MSGADWVGFIAGALTTFAFIPQVIRIWRTRSARDISLGMYWVFTSGVALWVIYGFMLEALPVIVTNGITLVLSAAVLVLKLRLG
ncbi:MAG: SemiSWEET transporter [Betaproteobacteria bacterium]|nr:SemiSWEET transporter [Betaproteobacteria bacterium]